MAESIKRINQILSSLHKVYRHHSVNPTMQPLDELIRTILSQNTNQKNSHQAYINLKDKFSSYEELLAAELADIIEAIYESGLAAQKAMRIKSVLKAIKQKVGSLNLCWLKDLPIEAAQSYLLSFKGVGLKTANCVLLFGFGKPTLPVDTHIFRLARRLNLIADNITIEAAHQALQELIPESEVYCFHINMIRHGREICHARVPNCFACILNKICPKMGVEM